MRRALLPLVLLALLFNGVADRRATAQQATPPEIDFATKPSYIPNNVIVLTFDDGPDYISTPKVLDILKANNIKATFFINTVNWGNVDKDQQGKDLVKRIVAEGHELANHTVHHPHLGGMDPAAIENEIAGVEKTVAGIFGGAGPKLTLFRTPYGEPYAGAAAGSAAVKKVSAVVGKHAVHIGWAADTLDWSFSAGDADKVVNSVKNLMKTPGTGAYGAILMHCVQPQTASALQRVIDYLKGAGFVFKLTEDLVRAKYGKSSEELIYGTSSGTGGSTGTGGATADAGAGTGGAGTGGAGGAPADEDAGAGGSTGTGGGTGAGTGGSGPTTKADAGSQATGGKSGGSAGSTGTGGDEETGGASGGDTHTAPSGGCTYGGGSSAAFWGVSLACAALALARRRRRS